MPFARLIELPDGSVSGVDMRCLDTIPYWVLPNPPGNSIIVAPNQSSPATVLSISGEGPAEIFTMSAQRIAACRIKLAFQDGQKMRSLMNQSIHVDAIFGSGAQPYRLPESLFIDERRHVVLAVTDIAGVTNTVLPAFLAKRYLKQQYDERLVQMRRRMDQQQYVTWPQWYTLDQGPVTIPGAATIQRTITIGQDHHFNLMQMSSVSTGLFDINIFDITKNESIIDGFQGTNFAISSALIQGSNNFPFKFHEPIFFQTETKLQVTLFNRTAINNTVHLALGGVGLALRLYK